MCRQADLRVDRAGVNHLLTGLARMVLGLTGAYILRRAVGVGYYVLTRSDKLDGGWVISREWGMSRVNLDTLIDFMPRMENWDKGGWGTGEIKRAEKIGKWSNGETDDKSMTGCRQENVGVLTRLRTWWSRWVNENKPKKYRQRRGANLSPPALQASALAAQPLWIDWVAGAVRGLLTRKKPGE